MPAPPTRPLCLAAFVTCVAAGPAGAQAAAPAWAAVLDTAFRGFARRSQAPAAYLSWSTPTGRGDLVFGFSELETNRPAASRDRVHIGSLTKAVTAAVAAEAAAAGLLRLDAPIRERLPDFPEQYAAVTLRHLLGHTSGLPEFPIDPRAAITRDTMMRWLAARAPVSNPGTRFAYSNTGYWLVGLILDALGPPWERQAAALAARAGAAGIGSCDRGSPVAVGYLRDEALTRAPEVPAVTPGAGGALCASMADLVTWGSALLDGRLDSAVRGSVLAEGHVADGSGTGYGLGWELGRWQDRPRVMHSGSYPGTRSAIALFPREGVVIAVAVTTEGVPIARLLDRAAGLALGLAPLRLDDRPLPDSVIARLIGRYQGEAGLVTVAGDPAGNLSLQVSGQPGFRLLPVGPNRFAAAFDPLLQIEFAPGPGRAGWLVRHQGPTPARLDRLGN